jgi:hypothetical protein
MHSKRSEAEVPLVARRERAGRVPALLGGALAGAGLLAGALFAGLGGLGAQEVEPVPVPRQVGTMSDLMVKIIYPTSDAILYISSRTPTDEAGWNELQSKALMLAESANLLMSPIHAWDQDRWMRDAKLMLDAGEAAYEAAMARDVDGLAELNEAVYQSCVTCHLHYRPDYGK